MPKDIKNKVFVFSIPEGRVWTSFDRIKLRKVAIQVHGHPYDNTRIKFFPVVVCEGGCYTEADYLWIPKEEFEANTGQPLPTQIAAHLWIAAYLNPIGFKHNNKPRKIWKLGKDMSLSK